MLSISFTAWDCSVCIVENGGLVNACEISILLIALFQRVRQQCCLGYIEFENTVLLWSQQYTNGPFASCWFYEISRSLKPHRCKLGRAICYVSFVQCLQVEIFDVWSVIRSFSKPFKSGNSTKLSAASRLFEDLSGRSGRRNKIVKQTKNKTRFFYKI